MIFSANIQNFRGLIEIVPDVHGDERGCLFEVITPKVMIAFPQFRQVNQSESSRNVFRGLHFQKEYTQGKLVRCIQGEVIDYFVDLREGPTKGKVGYVHLSSKEKNMIYIPKGFAHGFRVVTDDAIFEYFCTDIYHHESEGGINPEILGFSFDNLIINERDFKWEMYDHSKKYFDKDGNWIGE